MIACFHADNEVITTIQQITALDQRQTLHVPTVVHQNQRKIALASEAFEILNKNAFVSLKSYALN